MEEIFIKPLKKYGSLWIYKNEILSDIKHLTPGSLLRVYESRSNKIIGTGYINPKSTISIRLLSFKKENIDAKFFHQKFQQAIKYREEFLGLKHSYRMIYSESDGLPGLIVDKYNNCLVIQILTAGMETFKDLIIELLDKITNPEIIVLKNDSSSRLKEGLVTEKKIVKGEISELPVIYEDDVKFLVNPVHGQKTGFFLDQRENRLFLKQFITAGEGLDLFCYIGSWSIHLAKKGASVTGIDSSEHAINSARDNAKINNLNERCKFIKADVFNYLKWEIKKNKRYDFMVVDPPAFVKSKNQKDDAIEGYLTLNSLALKLLKKDGILTTSSCSQHISDFEFSEIIKEALSRNKRTGKVLYKGIQSKDHPILLTMPETAYLKCLIVKLFD